MIKYKFLEHTADIKIQAFGKSVEEVFENCALAMFNSMSDENVKKKVKKKIQVEGKDYESLLYNFLEELLFLLDSEGFFLSGVENLRIKNNKLTAQVVGDSAENYNLETDIKAITYSEMFVREEKNKWIAQVVLDI